MKILQVHNYYHYPGGEDVVVKNEYELLTSHGNKVYQYFKYNNEIQKYSLLEKAKLFFSTTYSEDSYDELFKLIKKINPDICHIHNIFPLISPAVYNACVDLNVPVIQTLHNYRLICTNAYLFRNGKICEECIGHNHYHSIKYGCYRNSKIQTWALARSIEKNRKQGTWHHKINQYIALTQFARNKMIAGGLPEDKIKIKPNFLKEDPGYCYDSQNYFVFAGRLENTKGIHVLMESKKKINKNIEILIAGDGPLRSEVIKQFGEGYLGYLTGANFILKIKKSVAVIFPSIWYETFGMSVIEAFACGKPVIASRIGAMAEIIKDGKTGLLFEPGNANELAEKITWAFHNKEKMKKMGMNARKEFEKKYTAEINYKILMDIYNKVISNFNEK